MRSGIGWLNHLLRIWIVTFSFTVSVAVATQNEAVKLLGEGDPQEHESITLDFEHFGTGKVPDDFTPILSGLGKDIAWEIRPEPSARSGTQVLAQTSTDQVGFRFPLLLYNVLTAKNVAVAVQFKTVSGQIDQAAGIIVRFQDEDHFYVVRANALKDEVQLYSVTKGVHHPIARESVTVHSGEWHMMMVSVKDNHFTVFFDKKRLFDAEDDTYGTASKVGLSTKSDGVTIFDDFQVTNLDPP